MKKQEKTAQPQNATFAQERTHKDDAPLQGSNSEKLLIDKNELLFRLTAARNTALGTQSHNPQEVIDVFDAIIDLVESFDGEAGQKTDKPKKCLCCRKLTTDTYRFQTRGVNVKMPLCVECQNIEDIKNRKCIPLMHFIVAAENAQKELENVYIKYYIKKMREGDEDVE